MSIFQLHREPVRDEWLDYYGHMNMGYYMVPFGKASWDIMERLEFGADYFKRTGCAFYTLESHLRYVAEVRSPAIVDIEGMVMEYDEKRIRYGLIMKVDSIERATCEFVDLHFDTKIGRSAPMPESIQKTLQEIRAPELPEWAGSKVSLTKT